MVKKVIVKYNVFVNGECFFKERMFDTYQEAFDYMTSLDTVYKFQVSFIRSKSKS